MHYQYIAILRSRMCVQMKITYNFNNDVHVPDLVLSAIQISAHV